ncbi:hypothetical protein [Burkholderia cenocepacia]|uniref:hypothetical protein n=1 Tax=Burkholderia cenocepacia TaxID=95486 RepID=UPI000D0BF3A9|nr:hypothetical protein [Burkholderia cenocepacia]MDI9676625.1 hypothetical protein [Burkholderia cenocepacia]MDR8032427.1 hypothetical protein [Burkholderia cenocepacia]SOT45462.1 conserved hypothetical protein [Burkholderia cenocepacia]
MILAESVAGGRVGAGSVKTSGVSVQVHDYVCIYQGISPDFKTCRKHECSMTCFSSILLNSTRMGGVLKGSHFLRVSDTLSDSRYPSSLNHMDFLSKIFHRGSTHWGIFSSLALSDGV